MLKEYHKTTTVKASILHAGLSTLGLGINFKVEKI